MALPLTKTLFVAREKKSQKSVATNLEGVGSNALVAFAALISWRRSYIILFIGEIVIRTNKQTERRTGRNIERKAVLKSLNTYER